MATKSQVKALAKKLGVELSEPGATSYIIDAPHGKVFDSTFTHYISYDSDNAESMSELWASVLNDLEYGLLDCTTAACENCAESAAKPKVVRYYKHRPSAHRAAREANAKEAGEIYAVAWQADAGWFIEKLEAR